MSAPVSQPVIPPEPDQVAYSVQALALFPSYTRDSYLAAFGIQAPPWDPSRLTKTWFDTTVDVSNPANVALYKVIGLNPGGKWGPVQLVIPVGEAATVNLTGSVSYPPYSIDPTQISSGGAFINAMYLSLESDARALMQTLDGSDLMFETGNPVFPIVYPAGEPRRIWDLTVNGAVCNAGTLLAARNANGIGAPGHWQPSAGGPVWVPDPAPTGANDMRQARPIPVRDLLPNEELQMGLMGVSVVRTDLVAQQGITAGQFTPDDRATLQQIYQMIGKLG